MDEGADGVCPFICVMGSFAHGCASAGKRLAAADRAGKNLPQSEGAQIADIRLTHFRK